MAFSQSEAMNYFKQIIFLLLSQMSMNAFFSLTTVSIMLTATTQLVHLYAIAMMDIPEMVLLVKVS